jgi:ATP-dependent exoDNAse (exonuclease V) alpha subunit
MRENGKTFQYDPSRDVSGVQVFTDDKRGFSMGDKIQFTAPWKERQVSNRETAEIMTVDQLGNLTVFLDSSQRTLRFNIKQMPTVDHAYAMTSYSAQGQTVDKVILHIEALNSRTRPLVDKTLAYVGLSRARYEMAVYTDDMETLPKALARRQVSPKALNIQQIEEYLSPEQREQKKQEREAAITR